jgi:hypothetical protein
MKISVHNSYITEKRSCYHVFENKLKSTGLTQCGLADLKRHFGETYHLLQSWNASGEKISRFCRKKTINQNPRHFSYVGTNL